MKHYTLPEHRTFCIESGIPNGEVWKEVAKLGLLPEGIYHNPATAFNPQSRAQQKKHNAIPEVKARKKAYSSRPERMAKKRETDRKHQATPGYKAKQKEYHSTPEYKAKQKEYRSTSEYKAKRSEYDKIRYRMKKT